MASTKHHLSKMKPSKKLFSFILMFGITAGTSVAQPTTEAKATPVSTSIINSNEISDKVRSQQVKGLKWGMFICWSYSTFYGREWTPTRKKDASYFKATGCDTDQWARTAKDAGMGYILFLPKHHDGFCLWDTKTTEKKVTNSPLGIDVLAKLRKSCDKYGIKLALYFSEGDWNWPEAIDGKAGKGGNNPEVKKAQLKELLTNYGPIEFWWMDHAAGTGGLGHKETVEWMHKFQPNTFVGFNHGEPAGRLCLRERGKPGLLGDAGASAYNKDAEASYKNYQVAEFTYPILPTFRGRGGADWFYSLPKNDNLCHAPMKIYGDYMGAQKYQNIFSINVGPNYEGKLREIDVKTLGEVGEMIRTDERLKALKPTERGLTAKQVETLLSWLKSDKWWMQRAALKGLIPAAGDARFYGKVVPALEPVIVNSTDVIALEFLPTIIRVLEEGSAEMQKAGVAMLGRAYMAVPKPEETTHFARKSHKNPTVFQIQTGKPQPRLTTAERFTRNRFIKEDKVKLLANCLTLLPGGYDKLYEVSRLGFPKEALPHEHTFLSATPKVFGPATKKQIASTIRQKLVPTYIDRERAGLTSEAALEPQKSWLFGSAWGLDGLATLYRMAGVADYDWHLFGPARDSMQWAYYSFDPADKKPWKRGTRYREVKLPASMEKWTAVHFDPAKAGWNKGLAPFGSLAGKLEAPPTTCSVPACGCNKMPKTLWEKEVLLLRGTFTFPPMKLGHRYRLLIGGGCHVFEGDGVEITINGKHLTEQATGPGKFQGNLPRGVLIDKETAKAFAKGPVTIAVKSFLYQRRSIKKVGNQLSLWMEEMKLPPVQ
jgi:alpha-L-fucosidase